MPWKNGGGRTTEIAVRPAGAGLDDFSWRVSIAEVERDGPFSRFPGVDRTIVLVEGAGMRLRGAARDVDLRTPFEPHLFAGEEALDCALVDGPIRDFNAMVRRSRARGTLEAVDGAGATIADADFRLVFALTSEVECRIGGGPAIAVPNGHALIVERTALDDASPIAIRPRAPHAMALALRIECL